MRSVRRLSLGLFCLGSLPSSKVWAQPADAAPGTETLETPYEDAPPPAPAPPLPPQPAPAAPTPAPANLPATAEPAAQNVNLKYGEPQPEADTRPIRARRRLALTGELGWNGIAGFGPVLTYHLHPHFSVDLGAGVSLFGWKGGVRTRYNFLTSPFTPFVGVGVNATKGLGELTFDTRDDPTADPTREPATVDLKPSYLVQGTLGFDFIHRRGFTMLGCLGYAWLLNEDNVDVLAGSLSEDDKLALDVFYKSGIVLSMSFGYAWQ